MTTEDEAGRPSITPVIDFHQAPDYSLVQIAGASNFFGLPLTLYMPWGIAVGHTASFSEYYQHLADSIRAGASGQPQELADATDQFARRLFDPYTTVLTSHLVLKDARCYIGGGSWQSEHPYLRVRLTSGHRLGLGHRHNVSRAVYAQCSCARGKVTSPTGQEATASTRHGPPWSPSSLSVGRTPPPEPPRLAVHLTVRVSLTGAVYPETDAESHGVVGDSVNR